MSTTRRKARSRSEGGAAPGESPAAVPRRVWTGTLWQVGGRLFGSAATACALFLAARALSGAEFGRLTFYLALFLVVDAWTDLGSSTTLVQRAAGDERALARWLPAARALRARTALCGGAAIALAALALGEPGGGWIAAAGLYPLSRVPELSSLVYQSRIRWRLPVATRALASLLRLGLFVALALAGAERAGPWVLAHALGLALGNLALWALARGELARLAPAAPRAEPAPSWRALVRLAWPIGATAVVQQAYFYADNLFVRAALGTEVLGRYNAAVRVGSLAMMAGALATSTALPWLAGSWREGRLGAAATRLAAALFGAAGLALGALVPWSERLLALLFGPPFAAGGASLRWLLLGALVVHAGGILYTALLASGARRAVLAVALGGLALNVAGNAWLVPWLGAEGAAIATVATELWVAVAAGLLLARRGGLRRGSPWPWLVGPLAFAGAWAASGALARFVA